jgi:hypothetical protein
VHPEDPRKSCSVVEAVFGESQGFHRGSLVAVQQPKLVAKLVVELVSVGQGQQALQIEDPRLHSRRRCHQIGL